MPLRNIDFRIFDDGPKGDRILMFYTFETDGELGRSGILHYHLAQQRFLGPKRDAALTDAALAFLSRSGCLRPPGEQ